MKNPFLCSIALCACQSAVSADVVINMPPVKSAVASNTKTSDEGRLALTRYTKARTATYNTYGLHSNYRYWRHGYVGWPFFVCFQPCILKCDKAPQSCPAGKM